MYFGAPDALFRGSGQGIRMATVCADYRGFRNIRFLP
ncbi:MAG: hypothetical protein ACJAZ5_002173 [Alloalcanivorax venustensis]|jgi:hypothetical protein